MPDNALDDPVELLLDEVEHVSDHEQDWDDDEGSPPVVEELHRRCLDLAWLPERAQVDRKEAEVTHRLDDLDPADVRVGRYGNL